MFHFHGNTGQTLDHVFTDHARVAGRSAGNKDYSIKVTQHILVAFEPTEFGSGAIVPESAPHGILQGGRLFVNLFFHIGIEVPKLDLLEKLVRGKSMDHPTEATLHFADQFKKMMAQAGCWNSETNSKAASVSFKLL